MRGKQLINQVILTGILGVAFILVVAILEAYIGVPTLWHLFLHTNWFPLLITVCLWFIASLLMKSFKFLQDEEEPSEVIRTTQYTVASMNRDHVSEKWPRVVILLVLGVLLLATGLIPQIDRGMAKYAPLGLIISGLIMAVFRKTISPVIEKPSSGALGLIRAFDLKPRPVLFIGVAFIVGGILIIVAQILLSSPT